MHSTNSTFGVVALLLLFMIIDVVGWERLPNRTQSQLKKVGCKLIRWRRENPTVNLEVYPAPGEKQRQNTILNWLDRKEVNPINGGQALW